MTEDPKDTVCPAGRMGRRVTLAVPVAAFVLFLAYLAQIRDLAFFRFQVANPLVYDVEARQLLAGLPSGQPFFLSALYPAFVALVYRFSGASHVALVVVQGLLGALNVWLAGAITRRLFSDRTAFVASVIMAFYWSFYYFAGEMVPATVFVSLLLAATLLFVDRDLPRPSAWRFPAVLLVLAVALVYAVPALGHLEQIVHGGGDRLPRAAAAYWAGLAFFAILAAGSLACLFGNRVWRALAGQGNLLASGLVMGASALAWSGSAAFAGLLALWLALAKGRRARAAFFVAALLVPIMASVAYNGLTSGDFVAGTTSFGVNLFIGANPASDGMDPFKLGEANSVRIQADKLRLAGKPRSDFFAGEALRFIRTQPGRWLVLEARKLLASLGRTEINNNADIAERRAAWKVAFLPRLHFGIVFPLAAVGALCVLRGSRKGAILIAGYLSFLAVALVFFACERFRLPAVAFLVPLAAYGVESLVASAHARRTRALALALGVAAAAAVVSNVDFLGIQGRQMPSIVANKAYVERLAGNTAQARALAVRALELDPAQAGALFQLGALEDQAGAEIEALTRYLECLEADPFFAAAYEAAAKILDSANINRAYLDAYVEGLIAGDAGAGSRGADILDFLRRRSP
jgi:tetratricopeptide (TPR) repeat protein